MLLRNEPTITMTRVTRKYQRHIVFPRGARSGMGVGVDDFVYNFFDAKLVVMMMRLEIE